jgi:hypothetical protein
MPFYLILMAAKMSENPKENTIFGRKKKEISENNLNILHSE